MDKCKKCGSKNFLISDTRTHNAILNSDSILDVYNDGSSCYEGIECAECNTVYTHSDFSSLNTLYD